MRRTRALLHAFTFNTGNGLTDVDSAVEHVKRHYERRTHDGRRPIAEYGIALGRLGHSALTEEQDILSVIESKDRPGLLQISHDACRSGVVLTDKSVARLLILAAANLKAAPPPQRASQLEREAMALHWHARGAHVFGPFSIASLIHCCGLVPDLPRALHVAGLAGKHVSQKMLRALLGVARNVHCFETAQKLWQAIDPRDARSYRVFLQAAAAADADAVVLDTLREMHRLGQKLGTPVLRGDHFEIALRCVDDVPKMREVLEVLRCADIALEAPRELAAAEGTAPAINAQLVRILLRNGLVAEAELIARSQHVATHAVHGKVLEHNPSAAWIRAAMGQAGLQVPESRQTRAPTSLRNSKADIREQSDAAVAQGERGDDDGVADKRMAAIIAASGCFVSAAAGVAGPALAATGHLAAGAVAGCALMASRNPAAITRGSLAGSAAWAGAALIGTTPIAAGAFGSAVAFSSAAAYSYLAARLAHPAALPAPSVAQPAPDHRPDDCHSIFRTILRSGAATYEGPVAPLVAHVAAAPLPLAARQLPEGGGKLFRVAMSDLAAGFAVLRTRDAAVSPRDDAYAQVLREIRHEWFEVKRQGKGTVVFTWKAPADNAPEEPASQ
ncbi:hypothetical protein DIPPA_34909 [Diplonema papillatum]|nr:hypothetical protein DIPPA_34909 [Diplonema papillatum]